MPQFATNKTSFGLQAKIIRSGEIGTIRGYCRYERMPETQFYLEYTDANGRATERWFFLSEIEPA